MTASPKQAKAKPEQPGRPRAARKQRASAMPPPEDPMCLVRRAFQGQGPQTQEEALRLLARALGYTRLGSNIRRELENVIRTAVRRGVLDRQNGTLSILTHDIQQYTRDHLVEQLLAATGRNWIELDEAITATARHLGYARTGEKIRDTLRKTITLAKRRGLLESDGSRIRKAR